MTAPIREFGEKLRQSVARIIATSEEPSASPMLMDLTIHEVMEDLDPGMLGWKASSDASMQTKEGRNHAPADH